MSRLPASLPLARRVAGAALAVALLACGRSPTAARDEAAREETVQAVALSGSAPAVPPPAPAAPPSPEPSSDAMAGRGVAGGSARAARGIAGVPGVAAADGPADAAARVPSAAPTMVIRTGSAALEVDSLDAAIARLRTLAAEVGGYVAGTTLAGGREQVRSASLELRVPAPRFDALMAGLRPLGRVERIDVQAHDVGEEFVDVSARVANAQRLEARLVALLERRTGKLDDVLAVERELARVREEIERHEGRLRWLRTRVATSTLTVALHEPFPLVGHSPAASPVREAFRDAWRNFVALAAAVIASSGVWLPVGALVLAAWRWRRHRAPRPLAPPAA